MSKFSLDSNVFNMYVKFQVSNLYNERDIYVQKIKVKSIFEYILYCLTDSPVDFYYIYVIKQVSYPFLNALTCIYLS